MAVRIRAAPGRHRRRDTDRAAGGRRDPRFVEAADNALVRSITDLRRALTPVVGARAARRVSSRWERRTQALFQYATARCARTSPWRRRSGSPSRRSGWRAACCGWVARRRLPTDPAADAAARDLRRCVRSCQRPLRRQRRRVRVPRRVRLLRADRVVERATAADHVRCAPRCVVRTRRASAL